jgi:hypothetical protein
MYQDADYDHNEMLKLISRYRRGQYVPKTRAQLQANPSIPAQLRRLPSGEIQLKIPLGAKNVKAQVQAIRKALGRRVKSAVIVGGKIAGRLVNPEGWKWQGPWVVLVKSQSGEAINSLSATFPTESAARIYRSNLISRGLHRGRVLELLHNTGTNKPGGVKVVSSKSY